MIAQSKAAPTFDNTIAAMERSGQLLDRAGSAFGAVTGANTNDTLQAAETALAPNAPRTATPSASIRNSSSA
ncbi:hypothetical protein AB5I41_20530 [Sphingomonas sp. MMS24-JH45]